MKAVIRPEEEMKDSGVEWIGEIPKEWTLSKVGYFFDITLGKMLATQPTSDDATLENYACAANLKWSGFDISEKRMMWFTKSEKEQYLLKQGDVLVMEGGAAGTSCIYCGEMAPCYMQNSVNRCRAESYISNKYLWYWLFCLYHEGYIESICNRATIMHYTKQKLSSTPMLVLDKAIQNEITDYLDSRITQIDSIISEAKKSIEDYKALKQSIITEAVTKGLDKNVPMKKSGVEGLDEIPAHWNECRLKVLIASVESGLSAITGDIDSEESGSYILRTSAASSGTFKPDEKKAVLRNAINRLVCPVESNTLVMSRMNTAKMVGYCVYIPDDQPNTYLPDKLWKIKTTNELEAKHAWYLINSNVYHEHFASLATGTSSSMINITINDLTSLIVAIPEVEEQSKIVRYLDERLERIDSLISEKQSLINELKSYKKSLIYEVVTGKRKVVS